MPGCESCPYQTKTCPSEGPKNANLLIIGESLSKEDVLIEPKQPFCGPSGEVLNETLSAVGIDRSEVFLTNTVACRIPDNNSPSEEAIKACKSRWENEIEKVDPDVILALGSTASKEILNTDKGLNQIRGKAHHINGRWVVPTFDPNQCLGVPETFRDFQFDVKKAQKVLDNEHDFPELDLDYKVATDILQLKKFLNYMKNREDEVSCDIETTGLDWRRDDILAIGFGNNTGNSLIIDWREIDYKDKAERILRWFFRQDKPEIIWHNGQFDRKFLEYQHDIKAPLNYDTMVLHHVGIDERSGRDIRSLGKLSKEWLNADNWEDEFHEEYVEPDDMTMADAPKDKLFKYLSKDVDATYRLFNRFWDTMDEQLKKCYHTVIQPSQETLVQMEQNGLEADVEHLKELDDEYSSEITQLRSKLKRKADELGFDVSEYVNNGWAKSAPEEYFNPSSDFQCHYMYFDVMDFPKYQGDHTASADAREHFKDNIIGQKADPRKEFIELHDRFKAVSKLYSTYIKGLWKHIDNGRIYTDYLLFGTRSGRLSSRNPNFQNIASQEDVKNVVTSAEGKKIMEIDFSQNEVRALAHLSGDPTLKEMFQSGEDFHDQMAEKVFGKDWDKGQRRIVKIIVFSILYGAGPPKIASNINASLDKAKEWIGYVKETMPVAWEYLQELANAHEEKNHLDTPTGRRIRFDLVTRNNKHKIKKKSMNLPIQGTASDLTLLAANSVREFLEGMDAQLVNMVHDSVMIEYAPDLERMLVAQVPGIMERTAEEALDSDIPWVADVDMSRKQDAGWGQLREITRERWLNKK